MQPERTTHPESNTAVAALLLFDPDLPQAYSPARLDRFEVCLDDQGMLWALCSSSIHFTWIVTLAASVDSL